MTFAMLALALTQRHVGRATPVLTMAVQESRAIADGRIVVPALASGGHSTTSRPESRLRVVAPAFADPTIQAFTAILIVHIAFGLDTFILPMPDGDPVARDQASTWTSSQSGRIGNARSEWTHGNDPSVNSLIGADDAGHFHRVASPGTSVFTGMLGARFRLSDPTSIRPAPVSLPSPGPGTASPPKQAKPAGPDPAQKKTRLPGASVFIAGGSVQRPVVPVKTLDQDLSMTGSRLLLQRIQDGGLGDDQQTISTFLVGPTPVSLPVNVIAVVGPLNSTLTSFLEFNAVP